MMLLLMERATRFLATRGARIKEFAHYFLFRRFCAYGKQFLSHTLIPSLDELLQKNLHTSAHLFGKIDDRFHLSFNRHFPHHAKSIIEWADTMLQHVFDLLGSGPQHVDRHHHINWHTDFKSGYQWSPRTYFRFIKYKVKSGVDIKIPWELSRFQSQLLLAQAFILTKEKKYVHEFQSQVLHWIENNPPGFGVNWKSNMDVAIRVVNWLITKELIEKNYRFPDEFLVTFYSSVYDHGRFIRTHFHHVNGITSNHYLSELAGLLFIAAFCPFFKISKSWQNYAMTQLEKEAAVQIYPDGTDYEASTSYHRLVLEILLFCLILAAKNAIPFSEKFRSSIKKMSYATSGYLKPNGYAPQIGDNDSGQFIKLFKRASLDHSYLISIAAAALNDRELDSSNTVTPEVFWLFGDSGIQKSYAGKRNHAEACAYSYADSGWYVRKHNKDYICISCGNNGKMGLGGHGHNDKLSFELFLGGLDIFVDPGTFVYLADPVKRNQFRSTRYHNTLYFEKTEQNDLSKGPFCLHDSIIYHERRADEFGQIYLFAGEIAYNSIRHKRQITIEESFTTIEICDSFSARGTFVAYLLYHLAPELSFENNAIKTQRGQVVATIHVEHFELNVKGYQYSPAYGIARGALVLEAKIPVCSEHQKVKTTITKKMI